MDDRVRRLFKPDDLKPGASPAALAALKRALPGLPADYLAFLAASDGAEGFVGSGYIALWRAGELASMNELYAAEEFYPGMVLFGSNGGDAAFAFDTGSNWSITEVPWIASFPEDNEPWGTNSFVAFLEQYAAAFD